MAFNGWAVGLNGVILTGSPDGTQAAHDADCPLNDDLVLGCTLEAPPDGLGLPALRTEDVTYAQKDGVEHFSDWYQPRIITIPVVTVCPGCGCGPDDETDMTAREAVKRILTAWDRHCGDTELVIWTDCNDSTAAAEERVINGPFGVVGRPRVATVEWHGPSKCATMLLRFDAVDQRMYVLDACGTPGSGEVCETVTAGSNAKGICFNQGVGTDSICFDTEVCFDTVLGTPAVPETITVLGDVCPYVYVTLHGFLTGPVRLTNQTTGLFIDYFGSVGSTPVVIDLANGTASEGDINRSGLVSGPMSLQLGDNIIKVESSGINDTGYAEVCFRPTVLSA